MNNIISKLTLPLIIVSLVLLAILVAYMCQDPGKSRFIGKGTDIFSELSKDIDNGTENWNKTKYEQLLIDIDSYTSKGTLNSSESKNLKDKLKTKAHTAFGKAVDELCSFDKHGIAELEAALKYFSQNTEAIKANLTQYRSYLQLCSDAVAYCQNEPFDANKDADFSNKLSAFSSDPKFNSNPNLKEKIDHAKKAIGFLSGSDVTFNNKFKDSICRNCNDITKSDVLFYDPSTKLFANYYVNKCRVHNQNLPAIDPCQYR